MKPGAGSVWGGGWEVLFFEFNWEVSGVGKRKWAVSRVQEESGLQRKRTTCIASWTKRRRLGEKRKKKKRGRRKKGGGVRRLRGDRMTQQQRILESDYDYNFQHQGCQVGLPWEFFLSNCYFGGCGDRFLNLVGEMWIMGCCVVLMSYGKQNPDYPLGGTVACVNISCRSWQ